MGLPDILASYREALDKAEPVRVAVVGEQVQALSMAEAQAVTGLRLSEEHREDIPPDAGP